MNEHPIQFIRQEILDMIERNQTYVGTDEEKMRTSIDLAAENIIEHFNLSPPPTKE